MDRMVLLVMLAAGVMQDVSGLSLPSYIKPCKKDENLDACAVKHGNEAIPFIVKGDPEYRVPQMHPFKIEQMTIDSGSSKNVKMNINMTNMKVWGFKDTKFVGSKMDLKAKHVVWDIVIPELKMDGDYTVKGKFLILPIRGSGPASIGMDNVRAKIIFDYDMVKVGDGDHIKVGNLNIEYLTTKMHIKLDNLFNGDKRLSDETNKVLNDNWQELNKEMGPRIAETMANIMKRIFNNIFELIPYNNIFAQ